MQFKRPGQFLNYLAYRSKRSGLASLKDSFNGIEVEARSYSTSRGGQLTCYYIDGKQVSRSVAHDRLLQQSEPDLARMFDEAYEDQCRNACGL